jgi:chemotaxis protein histidine kinase CheA
MSGSSILGTGEVALIFDVDALGRLAVVQSGNHATPPCLRGGPVSADTTTDLTSVGDRS